jgi:nicotinate-nucleotide pyrophosphorylase (carboxylating)
MTMDHLDEIIRLAVAEDVGSGDITARATIPTDASGRASIIAKQDLILAGSDVAMRVFIHVDRGISFSQKKSDGARLVAGDVIASLEGKLRPIVTAERTALNFLQRLSGVATLAGRYVEEIRGTKAKLLDTRKTTPGLRALEKHAAKMGGAMNHRIGLFDHFLIKNNHIAAAGSIAAAVALAKKAAKSGQHIEVEARTLDEVAEAVRSGADIIMLDNMDLPSTRKAVDMIGAKARTEASGNITLSNIRKYAECGVDYISVGAITHSTPAADIHMLVHH